VGKWSKRRTREAVTNRNEIGNGTERVVALRRGERLQSEVAAVAGEAHPESELVGCIDWIHCEGTVCARSR